MTLNYFAYGSNLASHRLLQRLPQASVNCVATLVQHQLCWRKNGGDNSGKCDIELTGDFESIVYGVVYRMTQAEQLILDDIESAGYGYERRNISVTTLSGEDIEAFTYYALDIDYHKQPYHWYKEHVLRGAIEHDFPMTYIDSIRAVESVDDRDQERHSREMSIYQGQ